MITPSKITDYHRSKYELEEFLMFCVLCAGKSSKIQAQKLEYFLHHDRSPNLEPYWGATPFAMIQHWVREGMLMDRMKEAKLGKYKLMEKAFSQLLLLNLDYTLVTVRGASHARLILTGAYGVGLKTASLFLLHSVEGCKMAVLDTHLLRFLRKLYPKARVPKASPQCPHKYRQIEDMWLGFCYRNDRDPATYDLEIWNNK
jgi:thermostable 8-oxoguanine DNA glycosylase